MWYNAIGFLVTLALSLLTVPLATAAQMSAKVPRIGVLSPYSPPATSVPSPIGQALRDLGYVEGQNIAFERRYAEGNVDRFPELAAELVRLPVDVLIAIGTSAAQAAQHATTTIPIVFMGVADPVGSGVVASLARPGANVTGLALLPTLEMSGKRLQLLTEAVPQVSRVAVLWNPAHPVHPAMLSVIEQAAPALGVALHALAVRDPAELERAFRTIIDAQANGLYVPGDPMLDLQQSRIAQFALEHRLPAISQWRQFGRLGGLMSYGPDLSDTDRRTAALADKILRGAKPADLPIEQPIKFELVINLKTAKALGITMPPSLLLLADEVIQ
jgi:putative ABC transport system substrate-binding protein